MNQGDASVFGLGPGAATKDEFDRLREGILNTKNGRKSTEQVRSDVRQFVEKAVGRLRGNHAVQALTIGERQLPLLGMSVPQNDYLAIMTGMLLVFVVGLWLSQRSLHASVQSMSKSKTLMELVRLQFTFTGLVDDGKGTRIASSIQLLAFWFPFIGPSPRRAQTSGR